MGGAAPAGQVAFAFSRPRVRRLVQSGQPAFLGADMASQIAKIDREAAKTNPEAVFETPESVLDEVGLTRGEKHGVLQRWAELVEQRLAAGNEGMPTRGTEPRDAELLQRIELAKMKLAGDEPTE